LHGPFIPERGHVDTNVAFVLCLSSTTRRVLPRCRTHGSTISKRLRRVISPSSCSTTNSKSCMADNELMHIDQPVAGPSSLAGSKRRRNEDDEDDPNGPTAVQGTSQGDVPRFKKARLSSGSRTSAPKRPNDWHMKRGEIPLDADKTKVCLPITWDLSYI